MSLAIHHIPLCVTFAYFEECVNHPASLADPRSLPPILDPTHLESTLCTGTLSITLNAQRELCVLSKAGGTALMPEDIMGVVRVGVERVRVVEVR